MTRYQQETTIIDTPDKPPFLTHLTHHLSHFASDKGTRPHGRAAVWPQGSRHNHPQEERFHSAEQVEPQMPTVIDQAKKGIGTNMQRTSPVQWMEGYKVLLTPFETTYISG